MSLIPPHPLVRISYPCQYAKQIPQTDSAEPLGLSESGRLDNFAAMDGPTNFADIRLAWNDHGLGVQVEVKGKDNLARGDASRPRQSDGVTLWIDTRDARSSHRATRYCHQIHLLPTGGGPEHDEPVLAQSKIHRALEDAPDNLDSSRSEEHTSELQSH